MQQKRWNRWVQTAVLAVMAVFVLVNAGIATDAAAPEATTNIKHKPLKYFVADNRIKITAKVSDKQGVQAVRCYFRADTTADYVFVPMTLVNKNTYEGILPAPAQETDSIEYLFLVVNGGEQVVRTQTYLVSRNDDKDVPGWQQVESTGDIRVSTEIDANTAPPSGFDDSIAMDVVESAVRFGFVAEGIYIGSAMATAGGASGSAATVASSGTVSASSGVSTAAVAGVAGGAAAVGVAAAAAGGSGGGGDDPDPGWNGTWSYRKEYTSIQNRSCYVAGAFSPVNDTIRITVSGNNATIRWEKSGISVKATISGNQLRYSTGGRAETEGCSTDWTQTRVWTRSGNTYTGTGVDNAVLGNGCRCKGTRDTHRSRFSGKRK